MTSMNPKDFWDSNLLFQNISKTTRTELSSLSKLKLLKKGEHLFWNQEKCSHLYIVASGLVILYKINSLGERKVIFTLGEGQIINEVVLQGMPSSVSCEAFADGSVICLDKEKLLQVMEKDFVLTRIIFDSLSQKMRRLYRQLKNTSNSIRGDKKIAAKLWKLSTDESIATVEDGKIAIHITVTFLADMLGSKRETVSRQLKLLSQKGLIQMSGGTIFIADRKALADYFKSP